MSVMIPPSISRALWLPLLVAMAWAFSVGNSRAHQPYESSAVARWQHGRLEVTVTMANEIAAQLTRDAAAADAVTAAKFETLQPRLRERAADLFSVFAGEEKLTPRKAIVRRNAHGDAECVLIFDEPTRGPLRLRAGYLQELPRGYAAALEVLDEEERGLGARMLTQDAGGAELVVPLARPTAPEPVAPSPTKDPIPWFAWAGFAALVFGAALLRRSVIARTALLLAFAGNAAFAQRQLENLGRGMVVLKSSSTQTYVGWRMLGTDPENIGFNLYRSANGGAAVKLNATPTTTTTNFTDTPGSLATTSYSYFVKPVIGGVEGAASAAATLPANAPTRQYIPVPLQPTPDGAHDVKFCWVGDLNGDGEFDFVVDRQPPTEARQFLEAYLRDGTLLWRMNMGPNSVDQYNIEPGASAISIGHGDNVTVFDMDGDGRAEVMVRTANGVVFPNGTTLNAPDNLVQYLSVLDGMSGAELARAPIPNPILSDGPMNGKMAVFFPDGQRPSILLEAKNRAADSSFHGAVTVWDFRNGALTQRWTWTNLGAVHAPEGHQIRVADVDNDGKDEFVDIGYVLDDNGTQLFNLAEVVHGDRFHLTDMDPDRPGLEMYLIQQNNGSGLATAFFDPGTGAYIRKWYASAVVDVGRGVIADIDPTQKGVEMFSTQPGIYNVKGAQLYPDAPFPPETIWWNADLSREFVGVPGATGESPAIESWTAATPDDLARILTIYNDPAAPTGSYQAYGGRPAFWGDILGDWREEIIVVANDNSELRIYCTKTPATNRLYTLMHNPQYRGQTTTKGYVQSSYVDYYLGTGMTPPPPPPIVPADLSWRGGAGATTWDAGATASWLSATGTPTTFQTGQRVRFDIGANATTPITLSGAVQPGAVTFYSPKNHVLDGSAGSLNGSMPLVKGGAGSLTISGVHNFTGTTTVWDGALLVDGDLTQSPVTVWGGTWGGPLAEGATGGRIGGSGRFGQPVTVQYRGAIVPGAGMGNAGTVSFGAGLALADGSTLAFDLSNNPAGSANDRINVTGNLTLSGKVTIFVRALNGQLAPGTYTLLTYTGTLTGSVSNFSVNVPPGAPFTLAAGSGVVTLTVPVTRAPAAITWRGSGGTWDVASSANWLRAGTPDVFVAGDAVTFDATGAASANVTLATALPIASVSVNSATDYTLNGAGFLTGSGGLTKNGAGVFTVNVANIYTGPTVLNGGVLAVSAVSDAGVPGGLGAASAAASNLILNGGALRLTGPQSNTNRSLTLGAGGGTFDIAQATSALQISGVLTGSGALTKSGPGTLMLASANSFTGGTVITGGTLYLAGSTANESALGSGAVTLSDGTLKMADVQANDVAPWNLIVPAGASGRLTADGRCRLTGTLTGGGDFTLYVGFVRTDLRGNWSAFSGRIFVITDEDGGDFRITNTAGYPNALIDLGPEVFAYYNSTPPTGGIAIDLGALSGAATSNLRGGSVAGRTVTYRIGAKSTDSLFAGTITNGTGITAITKRGAGVLNLTGANNYTGATNVEAGTLLVNGSLAGSNVTVQNGALLGGTGTIAGNVTVQTGGRLAFVTNGAAISGLNITGNLTLNGTISIAPAPGAGALAPGTYTIATYSGSLGGAFNLVWLPPVGTTEAATFNTSTPGIIQMTISTSAPTITWTGASSGNWDTTTANWSLDGAPTVFSSPQKVRFDDTAATTSVALAGPLAPGAVLLENATRNYTFTGTGGGLAGFTGLTKNGAGKATLYSANSHTGLVTINDGILALGNDGSTTAGLYQAGGATGAGAASTSLGTGPIIINAPGQLRLGGRGGSTVYTYISANPIDLNGGTLVSFDGVQQLSGPIDVGPAGAKFVTAWNQKNLWLSGTLSGSGDMIIDDLNVGGSDTSRARVLVSAADNPFTGTVTINGPSAGYHGGRLAIENDSTLRFATVLNHNNAVPALLFTVPTAQLGALGGSASFDLPTTSLTVGGNDASTTFSGALGGTGDLVKIGTGTFTLAGTSSFTGDLVVSEGTLRLTGSLVSPTTASIAAGATLELSAGTLSVTGALTNHGTIRLVGNTTLTAAGGLTNHGTFDIIHGPQSLPPGFVNQGLVVDARAVKIASLSVSGGVATIGIASHTGHVYQLQKKTALNSGSWLDTGAPQTGETGTTLTFTAPAEAGGFYRVVVSPE